MLLAIETPFSQKKLNFAFSQDFAHKKKAEANVLHIVCSKQVQWV
jgi:hypothetical protein